MERMEEKGNLPESGKSPGGSGNKPKSHFNLRVNKKLFIIALLICLVLVSWHLRSVNQSISTSRRMTAWHMEQLSIELSDLENSLLEATEITEADLRLLYVVSQVVSWDFWNHPNAFNFGAEDYYHRMHAILRLRQEQGLTDDDQGAVAASTRLLAEMREYLMNMAEQAYSGRRGRLDLDPVIQLNQELDYTAWHFVEHDRLPGDVTLSDQEMKNKIQAIPGWDNAQITITPSHWQSSEFLSGYNSAKVELDGEEAFISYSAYTGDVNYISVPYFHDFVDAEKTVEELIQNLCGPDFSVTILAPDNQGRHTVIYHYKGVEIAGKEYDHGRAHINHPAEENRLSLWNIPQIASISEAELDPQLTLEQAREIVKETEDPVELPSLHYSRPSDDGLVLLVSAGSGSYILAYKIKSGGYVNAVTGEREVPYSSYYQHRIFSNSPVGHLSR